MEKIEEPFDAQAYIRDKLRILIIDFRNTNIKFLPESTTICMNKILTKLDSEPEYNNDTAIEDFREEIVSVNTMPLIVKEEIVGGLSYIEKWNKKEE